MNVPVNEEFLSQLHFDPLAAVAEYYASCLSCADKAIDYLQLSCLLGDDANTLRVGFADRTLGNQIPPKARALGKSIRAQLEALGAFRRNGREHFRGMVTLALNSIDGRVTGIYGRRIASHGAGSAEQHIGSGLFGGAAIAQYEELILTDRVVDAWVFYAAGHTNVTCAVGCELLPDQLPKLRRLIVTSPDIDYTAFSGCQLYHLQLPLGHTPHSYALEHINRPDPLAKLLRSAAWVSGSGASFRPALHQQEQQQQIVDAAELNSIKDNSHNTIEAHQENAYTAASGDCHHTVLAIDRQALNENHPAIAIEPSASNPTAPMKAIPRQTASPVPGVIDEFDVESTETETTITIETRRWRVRGLDCNTVPGVMRVNVMVYNERSDRFHVDSFDLYHARSRRGFLAEAAEEIGLAEGQLRGDMGRVLLKLEQQQNEQNQQRKTPAVCALPLTEQEQAGALKLLRDENLVDRILKDFEACGIVGELTGKLVGYLAVTSRLLDKPLGLIIQSSSAAGKSSLAEAILSFMPEEARLSCSAMTSQSLYYLGKEDLRHKILSVAEKEGVRDASYQLKILQSEGRLSLVSTSKEKGSGRTSTERYSVHGPVALLLTTTASDLDPELMNRCLVVSVDESPAQTAAIHAQQRLNETFEGFKQKLREQQITNQHQNAQRMLRSIHVHNPYAEQLGFAGSQTRFRRDHQKYLTLIKVVTLLHQYQREVKTTTIQGQTLRYLEVTRHDIALANRIADWALGRSIDELSGPTRCLLIELFDWARCEARRQNIQTAQFIFTRRQAREALGWSTSPLRIHLERLCQHEYVISQGRRQGVFRYSLLYDGAGRENQRSLLGLVDAASLVEPNSEL